MKMFIILILIVGLLILISFLPLWSKPGKGGHIYKVNTWTKFQLVRGEIFLD